MKIFVDTADIEEIKEAMETGVVDGVTTNPSLIKQAKEKHNSEEMKKYIKNLLKACDDKPVSLEVTRSDYAGMKEEANMLKKHFGRYGLVVKIPVNPSNDFDNMSSFDGLKMIKELSEDGIDVNATVVMSPEQAVLAAKAGAKYVSPFAGRIDDYIRHAKLNMVRGKDFQKNDYFPAEGLPKRGEHGKGVWDDNGVVSGVDLVWKTAEIFRNYNFDCQVLAASARNTRQVREFMLAGADITTMPLKVLKELTIHYKTTEGVVNFQRDTVPEYAQLLEDNRTFKINFTSE